MKYKVGDKVRIKSIDWYNKNKDSNGDVVVLHKVPHFYWYENVRTVFTKDMAKFCGKVVTIEIVWTVNYSIVEGTHRDYFTDEMIEGLVEETKPNIIEEAKTYWDSITDAWICPQGYQFVDENGNIINATKIVLEKKKKEYPKTYEECCKVLNVAVRDFDILDNMLDTTEIIYSKNLDRLLNSFRKLLICRDAYWKIAGEEMRLGKPWEPDWCSQTTKYTLRNNANKIIKEKRTHDSYVLTFPTVKMRDAFYENFKSEIESCKELL